MKGRAGRFLRERNGEVCVCAPVVDKAGWGRACARGGWGEIPRLGGCGTSRMGVRRVGDVSVMRERVTAKGASGIHEVAAGAAAHARLAAATGRTATR